MRVLRGLAALVAASILSGVAAAGTTPIAVQTPSRTQPVSYAKEVVDILDGKCVGCHNTGLAESRLVLETVAGMLKGGKRGPALKPGQADASLLFQMASHRVEPVMPPKDKKGAEALTPAELGILKLWIDAGARDDSSENGVEANKIVLGALPAGVRPINAVDLTEDGSRVAVGRANVVQVYDVASGMPIINLGGHQDLIQSLRYSPDGRRLAAGSYEIVTVWNAPTGGLSKTLNGHADQVKAEVVARDRKTAYSAGLDRSIRVWNLDDGKETRRIDGPFGPIHALALAPDETLLAVGGADNVVRLVKLLDGKVARELKGHTGGIVDLAFLPIAAGAGLKLASASLDGTVRIWDPNAVAAGVSKGTATTSKALVKVDPKADPKAAAQPAEPVVLKASERPLRAIAVTPDGSRLLAAGDDGRLRVWKRMDAGVWGGAAASDVALDTAALSALAVDPSGRTLVAGTGGGGVLRVDLSSMKATGRLEMRGAGLGAAVASVAFSPGGTRVAAADAQGGVKIWDASNGHGVIAFGHSAPNNGPIQPLQRVVFRDEASIVTASADRTLKAWSFEGVWNLHATLGPHAFRVLALDFNADGTLLAAGGGEPSRSGQIKLWEVGKGMLVHTWDALHSDTVFALRFSPDGQFLASGAADRFLKVVRVPGGRELRVYEGHTGHVLAVDWSEDGAKLFSGGADNVVKVWDFAAGEQLRTLQPAGKQVTSLRRVAGGPRVAGTSGDRLVRLWNVDNGAIERSFSGAADFLFCTSVSRNGSILAAGGADGTLLIWNVAGGQLVRKIAPDAGRADAMSLR